jgi:Transglycosylase-like domain
MRTRSLVLGWIAALTCLVGALVPTAQAATEQPDSLRVLDRIHDYRQETWRWQRLMGVRLSPIRRSVRLGFHSSTLSYWRSRVERVRYAAHHPKRLQAWLCIHRYEGSWTANTGNGYYGGLQMDISFQQSYGRELLRTKGRAHRWSPIEQIWVAERAYRSGRGFYPWPNTARSCGLI